VINLAEIVSKIMHEINNNWIISVMFIFYHFLFMFNKSVTVHVTVTFFII